MPAPNAGPLLPERLALRALAYLGAAACVALAAFHEGPRLQFDPGVAAAVLLAALAATARHR